MFRGRRLLVDVRQDQARYTLVDGDPLEILHHGERVTLNRSRPLTRSIPPAPTLEPPTQPPGRAPARRRPPR
jgi:alpha,alpha-trehalose phosphorylase